MAERLAYPMLIEWSDEDDAYFVTMPDLPGCQTHGASYEEAARQGQDAIESWLDARRAGGRPLPEPTKGLGERLDPMRTLPIDAEEAAALERDLEAMHERYGIEPRRATA